MLRGYGLRMDPHNDARSGARRATPPKPAWRQSTPPRSSTAQSHRPPDPDNGTVESCRASGELPHDLHQSTGRDLNLRSAPASVALTVRTSRRQGVDHAAHVVASEGLLGPISQAKLPSSDHPAGQASGVQVTGGVQQPSRRWGDAPLRRRAIRHADHDHCCALAQSRWKSGRTDSA